jgi:PUB domain
MSNFFDRFKPGGDSKKSGKGSSNNNPLANWFGGNNTSSFSGAGQSLGGNAKPGIVIPVTLSEAGPLGIKVEKSSSDTAIVAMIVADSQAERAGLQRGDILCFAGSEGNEEINYAMFIELAASNQRPLCFEIRRIVAPSKSTKLSAASGTAKTNASTELSAEAFARKQAMIAAAEKREMEHNKKYNTKSSSVSSSSKGAATKPILSTAERLRLEQERQQRILENQVSDAANTNSEYVQKARDAEQNTVSQLGYNPYVAQSVSAGQARNAVTTTTHGAIKPVSATASNASNIAPGTVASPPSLPAAESSGVKVRPSLDFERAFEATVTSTPDHATVVNSISTMRKLIVNATTKGQQIGNDEEASKYRKIRFTTNAKIRAAVTDMPGALDLLLSVGFLFQEEGEENESVLVYPPATPGPPWLPAALQQMERYAQS